MKILVFFFICTVVATEGHNENCDVVPMKQWAGEKSRRNMNMSTPVDLLVIQHTVTEECDSDADCEKIVKSLRNYVINKLAWTDIGQSFLVGGNGKVYEGAGWHLRGAHTLGYNNRSISISFIGDFRRVLPKELAVRAAQNLISCGQQHHHLTEDYDVVGHRQLSNTESPGSKLQETIEKWPHFLQNAKELHWRVNIRQI